MNLEINIKVPIGAGVSVTQDAQAASEPYHEPPPIAELTSPASAAQSAPPSLEELGLVPGFQEPELPADAGPPSLAEFGLAEDEALAAAEVGPPSIEMLEGYGGVAELEEAAAPPSLEEMGLAEAPAEEDAEPPPVETLEIGDPAGTGQPTGRKSRARGKPAAARTTSKKA